VIVSLTDAIELVRIDVPAEAERLLAYGKNANAVASAANLFAFRWRKPSLTLAYVQADEDRIVAALKEWLLSFETPVHDASIVISSTDPLVYEPRPEQAGLSFRYNDAVTEVARSWSRIESRVIPLAPITVAPKVRMRDVQELLPRLPALFGQGDITLTYTDQATRRSYKWPVSANQLSGWLNVQAENGIPAFGLQTEAVVQYIAATVAPAVEREPRDAKFAVSTTTGNVAEFQGSRQGVAIDISGTYQSLNNVMRAWTWGDPNATSTIALRTREVLPNVTTGEANNLGITELLGTGISKYAGSPANRVKNIRNAVKKLNGVLIKPDEEFSALKYTEPFTLDGGYLPELVIKGDSIKPEIGGGLCQIGTTLFRMAMNSGMPITERRNHSLVVSYYNDLENGLPGTDATIYDSLPDFKFKNDTGNYVLIQTEMDEKDGYLFFSLWGKSDGRRGSYTKPEVKKWLGHGPTKIVETTTLAPGEKKCQHAYRGAETSFTYTRTLPDGSKVDEVFESYYRPLPEICLVGEEAVSESAEEAESDAETTTAIE